MTALFDAGRKQTMKRNLTTGDGTPDCLCTPDCILEKNLILSLPFSSL